MSEPSILLLAGEASGDHHAASLVRDIKRLAPNVRVSGIGGDKLAEAGMELLHHYREINTIGLSEGLGSLGNIVAAYNTMKRELRSGRHAVFIPVDYPDVNIRLCRFAKDAGVRVCYYISPQIWAWRKGRIRKIAERVDRMMTIFPFEERIYRERGLKADFVGHTMVKDIPPDLDTQALRKELGIEDGRHAVALLPGSRPAEIQRILPVMCKTARIYLSEHPDTEFQLPLAGPHLAGPVENILAGYDIPVKVHAVEAPRVMGACDSGLVTSGTATLQAALARMPHVVVYILDRFTWLLAIRVLKPLVMDKDLHVAIANVLSIAAEKETHGGPIKEMLDAGHHIACQECGRPLFVPEVLQDHATPERLAEWLLRFKSDESLRAATLRGFDLLRGMLAPPEGDHNAAKIVLECLGE